jgi:hypothetical protein
MEKIDQRSKNVNEKYRNHVQLVQGVCQVNDPTLTAAQRCFLYCLAAHAVKENPHPGNERLMIACGVKSRQAVNYIAKGLIAKNLVEIIGHPRGGRGNAAVYRIKTEDARFPSPKPAKPDLPVSDDKPANPDLRVNTDNTEETRKSETLNPQNTIPKPAKSYLHPNTRTNTRTNKTPVQSFALPEWVPVEPWNRFESTRAKPMNHASKLAAVELLRQLRENGEDIAERLTFAAANQTTLQASPKKYKAPGSDTTEDHRARFERNARAAGLMPKDTIN